MAKTDYEAAADRWNSLGDQIVPLGDRAASFGVLAAATLIHGDEYSAAQDGRGVLAALAEAAGFEVPEEDED